MEPEIISAVNFLVHILALKKRLPSSLIKMFHKELVFVLKTRYRDHWYPLHPYAGSTFRAIRFNEKLDNVIIDAGIRSNIPENLLKIMYPSDLILWVDPYEVSYKYGGFHSPIIIIYEARSMTNPWSKKNYKTIPSSTHLRTTFCALSDLDKDHTNIQKEKIQEYKNVLATDKFEEMARRISR